ncbi:cytochrome c biogenesis protein CcmG/thiol:disulfide interchange protein DsbE [Aminobacter niigataensis]|uniref:Cytochrome c biogenesis protein CcmG/thiol:disulfide interchange protein DsbE n=1 Tax=Aminobacter niigataensis TaxID=83265 RepID=A0ABR6L9X2_9HYPH|nr:DsbE family thiol:disulfide interchange protein [Aminobacter niigataensis]MBB4653413.1 cytochrome c biogenesis protein CcmG/thiol:disulfide interchange protein DsbE [Aminobacter niigataensis]
MMVDNIASTKPTGDAAYPVSRRLMVVLPVAVFAGLAFVLAWGLNRNAADIPSALIGKPVPEFSLPPVEGRTLGLSSANLVGEVSLVNVFASWCVACREEHPLFVRLAADKRVPVHGLNYKDRPEDAAKWLNTLGDPYTRTGADLNGRVAIDWGVYGVPETFVVSADGRIAYKHIGPVTEKALNDTILPLVERLRAKAQERRP